MKLFRASRSTHEDNLQKRDRSLQFPQNPAPGQPKGGWHLTGIIHPIWSEGRQDWVPLGELQQGEILRAADGPAIVLAVTILNNFVSVFNIEVHGEHVYQVGRLGLLVHNACKELLEQWGKGSCDDVLKNVMVHYRKHGSEVGAVDIDDYMFKGIAAMISRSGRGKPVEGFTEGVRRFTVHGTNRYVDVDTILEKVISYGRKFGS